MPSTSIDTATRRTNGESNIPINVGIVLQPPMSRCVCFCKVLQEWFLRAPRSHRFDRVEEDSAPGRVALLHAYWPREYLFVLGHMRCYSSVLAHVLGSHPEISGYGETHIKYRRRSDIAIMRWRILRATGKWPGGRYLLDKQLHNGMHVPPQLRPGQRGHARVRCLIVVRRPRSTLNSIVRMGEITGSPQDRDWSAAADYYCRRLAALQLHAAEFGARSVALAAETIRSRPQAMLARVGSHLQLAEPLSAEYALGRYTGRSGHGDMSERIRAGRILSYAAEGVPGEPVERLLPAGIAERCERAYERCVEMIRDWTPSFGFGEETPAATFAGVAGGAGMAGSAAAVPAIGQRRAAAELLTSEG